MLHGSIRRPASEESNRPSPVAGTGAHHAVVEAEEVEPFPIHLQVHDPGLGRLELKAQLGQDRPKRHQRRFGLPLAVAQHHQVIRVAPPHSRPALGPLPVEPMQIERMSRSPWNFATAIL